MLPPELRVVLACACLLGGVLAPDRPAAGPAVGDPISLPFRFTTRQPIIDVQLNGGPAVPFVVDTGATIHLIDREVARQASAGEGRTVPLAGGGQATVQTKWVDGLTLASGGQTWTAQRAALAPLGYPERKHFAGLLGAPILMRYTVQFDFPKRIMRLLDPARYAPPAGAVRIPFELQDDLPVIHVTIDVGSGPIDARLMVDTGASTFIDLNRPFVEAHRLVEAIPDAKAQDRPAALGGTAPFLYGTGKRATLGGIAFERPRLGLSRAQSGSSASAARDGVIGNAVVGDYVMTVDYRRKLIILERPGGG